MRSLADRLEAVHRTLLPPTAGHATETAWPMTHLVAIAAEASDEVLFRVADPAADRSVLAAFAAAAARAAQALALVADSAHQLLAAPAGPALPEARHAHAAARTLVQTAAGELRAAADRYAPARDDTVTDLARHRASQPSAALARSRIVSIRPTPHSRSGTDTPTAPVIPLRRR
ncbi:hypothetical protein ACFVVU_30695 [Kitasatospora sp. NPDC057965]|uniref:hypothetical protein n=1 Tax=Kitasatospora sp. NPDC057965 TaxID=3346291 RepID=UPI0036D80C9B